METEELCGAYAILGPMILFCRVFYYLEWDEGGKEGEEGGRLCGSNCLSRRFLITL